MGGVVAARHGSKNQSGFKTGRNTIGEEFKAGKKEKKCWLSTTYSNAEGMGKKRECARGEGGSIQYGRRKENGKRLKKFQKKAATRFEKIHGAEGGGKANCLL